jgi:phosphatidylglycerol:prolipoprotein diacylglycerol transferase
MVAIGFLVSDYVVAKRFRELQLDPELSSTILIYAVVFGVLGSKVYYATEFTLRGEAEFWPALFSRAGMVWFGGLILGTIGVTVGTKLHQIPTASVAAAVANAAPFGQACGRIGCFLVGDDYGKPTDAWYGIAFPEGSPPTLVPVHPTQLYETAWLLFIGAVLWKRRKASPFLFAEYGVLAGIGRFAVETLRVNKPVAFDLTGAQLIGLAMIAAGGAAWLYARANAEPAPNN